MLYSTINLLRIVAKFTETFDVTFSTNKKAHFDSVPPQLRVVDGAKSRWCNLLFVDALIYLSELREVNESSRRSFNQQQVLLECILVQAHLSRSPAEGANHPSAENISVEGDDYPWNSAQALRSVFLSDPTTKSKDKFIAIIDHLLEHPALRKRHGDVFALFRDVVHKALFKYPPLKGPSCLTKTVVVMEETPRDAEVSFDVGIFDDLAASELDTQPWDFLDAGYDSECEEGRPVHSISRSRKQCGGGGCDDEQKRQLTGFRSIADDDTSTLTAAADLPLAVLKPVPQYASGDARSVAVISPFQFNAGVAAPFLVPFPLGSTVLYERRVAFQAAPALQFTGAAAALLESRRLADQARAAEGSVYYHALSMESSPVFMEQNAQLASERGDQFQQCGSAEYGECTLDFDIDLECYSAWDGDAGGDNSCAAGCTEVGESAIAIGREATPLPLHVEMLAPTASPAEVGEIPEGRKRVFSAVEKEGDFIEDEGRCKRRDSSLYIRNSMATEDFNWRAVVESFVRVFEHTFATSKKAHFDCVPSHLRVVDGARSRWSNLIMLDAVIYMLEFPEFNVASRRAFNQQQVLFDCIKEELQRSNPLLHSLFLSRLRRGADVEQSPVTVVISDLTPPWTSATLLKRQLLSDPTAKSRDKFVGILESLFDNPALTQYGDDLRFAFTQVVTKIVYGFSVASMNRVGGSRTSSPSYDALSEMSSNDSRSSLLRVSSPSVSAHMYAISLDPAEESSAKRARRSATDTCTARPLLQTFALSSRAPTPTSDVMATGTASHEVDASPVIAPSRPARYATRSSTDGFRTGTTTVHGATYRCRYLVDPRRITQDTNASTSGGMALARTLYPAPDIEYPAPAEDAAGKRSDYYFDPALFDDPDQSESDAQPWEYLDDWAWEGGRNLAPFPVCTAPLGRPIVLRPPHCFSSMPEADDALLGGQCNVVAAPHIMPNVVHSLPTVRKLLGQESAEHDSGQDEAKGADGSRRDLAPTIWPSCRSIPPARGVYAASAVPFPDHSVHSLYSRRSAFRPVPPELQTTGSAACTIPALIESERCLAEASLEVVEDTAVRGIPAEGASEEAAGLGRGPVESASLPVQDDAASM